MPFYRFSATSTAADDGYSVIAPYVGTGRWLLLRESVSVGTVLELLEIPPQQRSPGISIYVAAVNTWYNFKSAAPALPGDVAPIVGGGSWGINTEIIEVIPPYRKVFDVKLAIAHASTIGFSVPQAEIYPVTSAIAHAESIGFSVVAVPTFPVTSAIAHAERFEFALVPTFPVTSAIAHASQIEFSVAALSYVTNPVYSQSSVLIGTTPATAANMADGLITEAAWADVSTNSWIEVSFDSAIVSGAQIGNAEGDQLPIGYGPISTYQNQSKIQGWVGGTWVDLAQISGVTATGMIRTFSWTPFATNRIRVFNASYLPLTEFRVIAEPGNSWLDLTAAEWLDLTAAEWLDLTV